MVDNQSDFKNEAMHACAWMRKIDQKFPKNAIGIDENVCRFLQLTILVMLTSLASMRKEMFLKFLF